MVRVRKGGFAQTAMIAVSLANFRPARGHLQLYAEVIETVPKLVGDGAVCEKEKRRGLLGFTPPTNLDLHKQEDSGWRWLKLVVDHS